MASTNQPRNYFATSTFLFLVSGLLTASTPNIADIIKNGGSIEKYFYLTSAILSGLGVSAEKMKNEPNLCTPTWCPLGKNAKDVIIASAPQIRLEKVEADIVLPKEISQPLDTTLQTVQTVIDDAKTVRSIVQNPLNLLKLL